MEQVNEGITTRQAGLDVLRAICSLMVVFIHIGFPGKIGQAIIWVCRIAVPCFFLISGYFYQKKIDTFDLKKHLKDFLRSYALGTFSLC